MKNRLRAVFLFAENSNKKTTSFEVVSLVRETGLEPASTFVHMNLNHARLPIPPFPHSKFRLQGI